VLVDVSHPTTNARTSYSAQRSRTSPPERPLRIALRPKRNASCGCDRIAPDSILTTSTRCGRIGTTQARSRPDVTVRTYPRQVRQGQQPSRWGAETHPRCSAPTHLGIYARTPPLRYRPVRVGSGPPSDLDDVFVSTLIDHLISSPKV
jgi:hypothetical protein